MRRTLSVLALSAAFVMSSCGSDSTTPTEGSSPVISAGDSTDSTINGRVAPNANGNNNDAPYVSSATP